MITGMEPRALHVSEADAVRDMASILQRVQAREEESFLIQDEPGAGAGFSYKMSLKERIVHAGY
jgi:hypothetical protein